MTKTKPGWARTVERAISLEREAADLREMADAMRCEARESGGERCTMNAWPRVHEHRIDQEDMPS